MWWEDGTLSWPFGLFYFKFQVEGKSEKGHLIIWMWWHWWPFYIMKELGFYLKHVWQTIPSNFPFPWVFFKSFSSHSWHEPWASSKPSKLHRPCICQIFIGSFENGVALSFITGMKLIKLWKTLASCIFKSALLSSWGEVYFTFYGGSVRILPQEPWQGNDQHGAPPPSPIHHLPAPLLKMFAFALPLPWLRLHCLQSWMLIFRPSPVFCNDMIELH